MKFNTYTLWWILLVVVLLLKSGVNYALADDIKSGDELFQKKRPSVQAEVITLTEPYVLVMGEITWFVQSQLTTATRTMTPLTDRQIRVVESVRKQLLRNVWYPRTMSVLVEFPTDEQIRYRGIDYFVETVVEQTTKYYLQQQKQPRVSL